MWIVSFFLLFKPLLSYAQPEEEAIWLSDYSFSTRWYYLENKNIEKIREDEKFIFVLFEKDPAFYKIPKASSGSMQMIELLKQKAKLKQTTSAYIDPKNANVIGMSKK